MLKKKKAEEILFSFFFQAKDGIRSLVRSRELGDEKKRQIEPDPKGLPTAGQEVTKGDVLALSHIHI